MNETTTEPTTIIRAGETPTTRESGAQRKQRLAQVIRRPADTERTPRGRRDRVSEEGRYGHE